MHAYVCACVQGAMIRCFRSQSICQSTISHWSHIFSFKENLFCLFARNNDPLLLILGMFGSEPIGEAGFSAPKRNCFLCASKEQSCTASGFRNSSVQNQSLKSGFQLPGEIFFSKRASNSYPLVQIREYLSVQQAITELRLKLSQGIFKGPQTTLIAYLIGLFEKNLNTSRILCAL